MVIELSLIGAIPLRTVPKHSSLTSRGPQHNKPPTSLSLSLTHRPTEWLTEWLTQRNSPTPRPNPPPPTLRHQQQSFANHVILLQSRTIAHATKRIVVRCIVYVLYHFSSPPHFLLVSTTRLPLSPSSCNLRLKREWLMKDVISKPYNWTSDSQYITKGPPLFNKCDSVVQISNKESQAIQKLINVSCTFKKCLCVFFLKKMQDYDVASYLYQKLVGFYFN